MARALGELAARLGVSRQTVNVIENGHYDPSLPPVHGDETQLVVIYDNIEHLRGTTKNAPDVAASVERLFRGHADALRDLDTTHRDMDRGHHE